MAVDNLSYTQWFKCTVLRKLKRLMEIKISFSRIGPKLKKCPLRSMSGSKKK